MHFDLNHLFSFQTLLTLCCGLTFGYLFTFLIYRIKNGSFEAIAKNIIQKAEFDAVNIKKTAELLIKQQKIDAVQELETNALKERKKWQKEEERIQGKEEKIEARMSLVEKKLNDIEKREAVLIARKSDLDEEKKKVNESKNSFLKELEKISGLSAAEAKDILIDKITFDVKTDAANLVRKVTKEAEETADAKASSIIATAINRLCVSSVSETTVHTVSIPNEEMKGRIIGREGRNIRALEKETGINFIIDDTPNAVVLSGFDPIRMHIAKLSLSELVTDGRIHPTRIEEAVEKAKQTTAKQIKQFGEDAALKAGVMNLHPQLIILLGKLKFRFSYGQNILDHSLEVSHLMGIMAAELKLDIRLAKRIGLLHDMGKALSHEVEGSHAIIGHDFALKYGESKEVANGIGCHHQEMEPTTIEASLCAAADAISASRPGARIEAVEEYINRLQKLEDMAYEFPGVEKAFALQAGREIRISVLPDMIDDIGVANLAKNLTKKIEQDLNYPGKIKVTVVREKRAVEYAI